MAKITTPDSLYGNSRDILREAERENEILADIAGEEYESPGDIPKGKYVIEKRLLDAAQKKNELLESIAEGSGGGGGAAKAIGIDYATDIISLKNKDGDVISGSGATLPAYGVSFDPTTGGLTLTKNGTAVQGQTVTIPNYGSPVGVTDSADMVDEGTIYLYEGTTGGGFTNGHFYYYDGSAWADGGEYAAATVQTDKTLLVEDRAADAKATGEAVGELKTQIDNITEELYTSSEETYEWASDAEPGFPYNWRPGYLSPSTGSIGTNAKAIKENLRNNKAVSFGTAKYITIAPPSGYSVSRIIEYNNSEISANNYSRAIASNLAVNENYTFENVIGKYYAFVINGFDNSNNYYQDGTFTSTIIATLTYKTSRLDGFDAQISVIEEEVEAAQEAITDIENKYLKLVSKTNLDADFNTIKDAIAYANEHPNTIIIVDSGEYDIIEELGGSEYTESLSGLSSYAGGLRLGNNTTIIGVGSGAKLIANYSAGTNQVMTDRFSIFNIVGSFKLENLEMEVTNVRYCVHEDMSALSAADRPGCYTGKYKNCRMKHNGTVSTTFNQACCIGGGTMNKSMHIIEGCSFESPTNKNPAGYHNNSTSNNGAAHVIVKNCYFANNGTVTFTIYNSNTQAINAEVDGCRLGRAIIDNSDGLFDIKAWNNVIA